MIVPIPNPSNKDLFGLVDINTDKMKIFRKQLFDVIDPLMPINLTYDNDDNNSDGSNYLLVHKIGNYNISIAYNYDDMEHKIDWDQYDLPSDINERKYTLLDKRLYPSNNYAYVIAQAINSVEDDGFGIIYPDPGYDYFPTAHEKNNYNYVDYDVKCYNCFTKPEYYDNACDQYINNLFKIDTINKIFTNFENKMTLSNNGKEDTFKIIRNIENINFFHINKSAFNMNIFFNAFIPGHEEYIGNNNRIFKLINNNISCIWSRYNDPNKMTITMMKSKNDSDLNFKLKFEHGIAHWNIYKTSNNKFTCNVLNTKGKLKTFTMNKLQMNKQI